MAVGSQVEEVIPMWFGIIFTVVALVLAIVASLMNTNNPGSRRRYGDKRQAPPISGSGDSLKWKP
jgi:hypothetical protein